MPSGSCARQLFARWSRFAAYLRSGAKKHSDRLVKLLIALALIPLVLKYWYETQRILGFLPGTAGGIDLGFYYRWTRQWFSGVNVLVARTNPQDYPPASIILLYPLTGMWTMEQARWVWAITTVLAIVVVLFIAFQAWGESFIHRAVLVVLLLYINGVGVTLGNGQATLHVLALVLSSVLLLHQRPVRLTTDLLAAALLTCALLKPNLSAPFIWLVVIFPDSLRVRPLFLIVVGYLALSLFAAQLVSTPLPTLFSQFLANRLPKADISIDPNLHFVLGNLGLDGYLLLASAICFCVLGIWMYRHRASDIWLLLAISTLVMRVWGFHWVYDNAFLIIPELVLLRSLKQGGANKSGTLIPAVLLALNVIAVLPPGNLGGQPRSIQLALALFQGGVWVLTLFFFLHLAGRSPILGRNREHFRGKNPQNSFT
jgi:hypothetical protein